MVWNTSQTRPRRTLSVLIIDKGVSGTVFDKPQRRFISKTGNGLARCPNEYRWVSERDFRRRNCLIAIPVSRQRQKILLINKRLLVCPGFLSLDGDE
jgi:hypothetical protein